MVFVLRQCLVNCKVHLAALDRIAIFDLCARITKLREYFVLWVVDENVAIREIKNLRASMFTGSIPSRIPKFPADLECDRRFAGTRCHRQKNPPLASDDGLNRSIDRDLLVVSLALI